MIDIVMHAPNKATFVTFAKNRNLIDAQNNLRRGVHYSWWAGTGKFMTQAGVYDEDGNEITPPNFLAGLVVLVRLHSDLFDDDHINGSTGDQELRSKLVKYVKDNGTSGTMGGFPYYELDGVKIFRPSDVETFLSTNGLPGHEFVGGNTY